MVKSFLTLGTAAVLGAVTLTTAPNPAAAQAFLVPAVVGAFLGSGSNLALLRQRPLRLLWRRTLRLLWRLLPRRLRMGAVLRMGTVQRMGPAMRMAVLRRMGRQSAGSDYR
jgi:hypothetical protein